MKSNKKPGVPDVPKAPSWSKQMRAYVLQQVAACVPYAEIYRTVTSAEFEDQFGIPALNSEVHTYSSFRHRALRLPVAKLEQAHEEWKVRFDKIRWATEKARVQGLSDLIDKLIQSVESGGIDYDAITEIRMLMEQIRKERNTDADRAALAASGTHVLIANPKNVSIDLTMLEELILTFRNEIGGLHTLDLSVLTTKELEQLSERCTGILQERTDKILETDYVEVNNDEGDDDNELGAE